MSAVLEWVELISSAIPEGAKKLFLALILLVCIDYITGLCVAVKEKKLSSKIGAKGLATKVTVFAMVAIGAIIDHLLIGNGSALCGIIMLFYCTNELLSICENANRMGLPLPEKLVSLLKDFQDRKNQR